MIRYETVENIFMTSNPIFGENQNDAVTHTFPVIEIGQTLLSTRICHLFSGKLT